MVLLDYVTSARWYKTLTKGLGLCMGLVQSLKTSFSSFGIVSYVKVRAVQHLGGKRCIAYYFVLTVLVFCWRPWMGSWFNKLYTLECKSTEPFRFRLWALNLPVSCKTSSLLCLASAGCCNLGAFQRLSSSRSQPCTRLNWVSEIIQLIDSCLGFIFSPIKDVISRQSMLPQLVLLWQAAQEQRMGPFVLASFKVSCCYSILVSYNSTAVGHSLGWLQAKSSSCCNGAGAA